MTEAEWLACDDPRTLIRAVCLWKGHTFAELGRFLGLLRQNKTERRYRLLACGCMRQAWHLVAGAHGREAVELAEQYADGKATLNDLAAARAIIQESADAGVLERFAHAMPVELLTVRPATAGVGVTKRDAMVAAYSAASEASELLMAECLDDVRRPGFLLSSVIRDIFGNPFRPVTFSPAWRTGTAVALARQMYESREFGATPILADALQDAGCDNDDVLNHCRDPHATHVRGCWVVDSVLGKE
jgi:hypothetical protein